MKVNSLQRMASPPAAADGGAPPDLRRSASASAKQAPSQPQPQPPRASTSTSTRHAHKPLPAINCVAAAVSADTPPVLTKQPSSATSSYYASMFSPRKLMQRASRAFRGSRRKKNAAADGGDVVDSPRSVVSKGSDADSVFSLDDQISAASAKEQEEEEEVVPEKIIHEANPSPAPVAAGEQEEGTTEITETSAAAEEEADPKKGSALPAPEDDEMAAAAKEKEQRMEGIKAEVVKMFEGRRARTTSGSNEAIEEARAKLLELRKGNRVKALVGAFETVMDENHRRRAASAKPQLNLRV